MSGPSFTDLSKEAAIAGSIAAGTFELIPASALISPEAFADPRWSLIYGAACSLRAAISDQIICIESINDHLAFHGLDRELQHAVDSTGTIEWRRWPEFADTSQAFAPELLGIKYNLRKLNELYLDRQAAKIGNDLHDGIIKGPEAFKALEEILHQSNGDSLKPLQERKFDFDHPPDKPPGIFLLANQVIATAGNLVSLYSQAKTGKSAVLSAMIAAAAANEEDQPLLDFLGFSAAPNPKNFALVHFDTEQSTFDHDALIRRALRRAQLDRPPSWLRSYCLTDLSIPERRNLLHAELHAAQKECGALYAVLLDGVGDLAIDLNDPAESNTLITELHGLAIKFFCPIIGVLHENPGDKKTDKQRGHLGSQLERKAESNIRLIKNADGTTIIYTDKSRHASVPRSSGPRFKWNPSLQMHASASSDPASPISPELIGYRHFAQEIFNCPEATGGLSWKQIHQRIGLLTDLKEGGCRKRFAKLLALNLIEKNSAEFYLLVNP